MDRPLSADRHGFDRRDFHSHNRNHHNRGPRRGSFRGRRGRGGGPRQRGNRFQTQPRQDPKQAALHQLYQLLIQIGSHQAGDDGLATQATNCTALLGVVRSKADLFLSSNNSNGYSPFVQGLVNCQAVSPLQTPGYAALVLAADEQTSTIVQCAVELFCRDLDALLLQASTDRPRAVVRLRLTLRALAIWSKMGIVRHDAADTPPTAVLAALNSQPVSLTALVSTLVQASIQAVRRGELAVAYFLADLVWSTLPYCPDDATWMKEHWMDAMREIEYSSAFAPGVGSRAILLKAERHEAKVEMDEEDDDEEEDDDDDGNEAGPVCDSWQDLRRTVQEHLKADPASTPPILSLFTEAPWLQLKKANEEGVDQVVQYTGEELNLNVFPACVSLSYLLGATCPPETSLGRFSLDGIVFGRLPIFGAPPGGDDDDDEEMEEEAVVNQDFESYRTKFGAVDRFFLGQAVRDCLISYESVVTDAGVTRGTAKTVAEHVWALRLIVSGNAGAEYCIVESILSLVAQCQRGSPFRLVYLARVLLELTRIEPAKVSPAIARGVSTLFQDYMPSLVPMAGHFLSQWFAMHLVNTDYQWPAAYWKHWEPCAQLGWSNSRGAFVKEALACMVDGLNDPRLLIEECLSKDSGLVAHLVPACPESETDALVTDVANRIWTDNEEETSLVNYLTSDEFSEKLTSSNLPGVSSLIWQALLRPARALQRDQKAKTAQNQEQDASESMDTDSNTDLLADLMDKIGSYKSLVEAAFAKDTERGGGESTSEENGDFEVLSQLDDHLSFSRSLHEGCLEYCFHRDAVKVASVMKWCAGKRAAGFGQPCVRWWEFATSALLHGMMTALDKTEDKTGDDMATDDQNTTVNKLIQYIEPRLSDLLQQIAQQLQDKGGQEVPDRKLLSEHVDLIEGFKFLVVECHGALVQLCPGSSDEALKQSGASGPNLASLIDVTGNLGVEILKNSLEGM